MYRAYWRHIIKAEKIGDRDVKFTFDGPGNRELPVIIGQLKVLPKHWWEGTDAQGKKRDITATTLEIPLGSGPYRIKEFVAGRSLVLERVKDYWGKDIPFNIGQNNFDELRWDFFRDDLPAREAFKADKIDWFRGTQRQGMVDRLTIFPRCARSASSRGCFRRDSYGRMQGFAFNLRRPLFQDVRLRRAFNLAYDWEEGDRIAVDR